MKISRRSIEDPLPGVLGVAAGAFCASIALAFATSYDTLDTTVQALTTAAVGYVAWRQGHLASERHEESERNATVGALISVHTNVARILAAFEQRDTTSIPEEVPNLNLLRSRYGVLELSTVAALEAYSDDYLKFYSTASNPTDEAFSRLEDRTRKIAEILSSETQRLRQ